METSPHVEAAREQKRALAQNVIAAVGGETRVVRHDLLSLWQRHGELILQVVAHAALNEEALLMINETAAPGELADLFDFAPQTTDMAERELFFASATVAAEVFRQIQRVELSPRTIQGPAPAPHSLIPIAAIGVVQAASPPVSTPMQVPLAPAPRVVRYERESVVPAQRRRVEGNLLTVAFTPDASWAEKWVTLKESLHSLLRWLILLLPALAVLGLIIWYGIAFMAWLMRTAGPAPGFILSLALFACVAGLTWWLWMKYGARLIIWAKQPKEHTQLIEDEGD